MRATRQTASGARPMHSGPRQSRAGRLELMVAVALSVFPWRHSIALCVARRQSSLSQRHAPLGKSWDQVAAPRSNRRPVPASSDVVQEVIESGHETRTSNSCLGMFSLLVLVLTMVVRLRGGLRRLPSTLGLTFRFCSKVYSGLLDERCTDGFQKSSRTVMSSTFVEMRKGGKLSSRHMFLECASAMHSDLFWTSPGNSNDGSRPRHAIVSQMLTPNKT